MQSKIASISETTLQVLSDVGWNVLILSPLAYYRHGIKTEAITELFVLSLIYNFVKSYAIRRKFNKK